MLASDQTKVRVGAITLVVAAAALITQLVFGGFEIGERISITIEFDHVGALREGADVQIAGRVVGRVRSISLSKTGATAHVVLEARYAEWAPVNAEVFIASKGLLSNRYIEIGPPPEGQAPGAAIEDGASLRGIAPVRVEIVVLRSIENTKQFRALLVELAPAVAKLIEELDALAVTLEEIEGQPGRFARLRESTSRLVAELGEARERMQTADVSIDRLSRIAAAGSRVAGQITGYLGDISEDLELLASDLARFQDAASAETLVKLGVALARAEGLMRDYQATAAIFADIMERLERGQGTVGGLLHDPEFIDEAKQLGKILKRQPWRLFGTNREKLDLLEP